MDSVIPSGAQRSRGIFSRLAQLLAWRGGPSAALRFVRGDGWAVLLALLLAAGPSVAVEPSEMLPDPAMEARAREIGQALRCVVCQNQSIDDSSAEVARDMRRAVRERLVAGDSNQQVFAFMVARYGDYVLLDPPFKARTLVLWLGAPVLLVVAGVALFYAARRRRTAVVPQPLTDQERKRLDGILSEAKDPSASPQDGG
jgi:cytochrome c-type biogenesis protein CcmH